MMKTGFGASSGAFEASQMEAFYNILNPVLEKSILIASHYAKQCGRDVLLNEDWVVAMKYCAMREVGKHLGSVLPDDENDDDDGEEEELELVEDTDIEWTPYEGDDDPQCVAVNQAVDAWATWEPTNPIETLLKSAVEKCDP